MLAQDREVTSIERRRRSFAPEWIVGTVGALIAAIGLWMFHGPSGGMLRLFGWEWEVADLAEAWPLSIIIGGAVIAAAVLARVSMQFSGRGYETKADMAAALSIGSILLALVYAMVWIF